MYKKTKELAANPSVLSQYARTFIPRKNKKKGGGLPAIILKREDIPIDRKKALKYARVCGYSTDGEYIPPTFPHIMAFALHMEILLDKNFPFSIVGMVHLNNTITSYKPITFDARLTIEVSFDDMKDHDKGVIVPLVTKVYHYGELVWESRSENLKRTGGAGEEKKKQKDARPPLEGLQETWTLDNLAGIRYAFTGGAGDFNPIHLMPITAKPFGFKRHIIHGMWTKARCVAALQDDIANRPFTVHVDFKLPVFLPAKVTFTRLPVPGGIDFEVRDQWNEKPHLAGNIRYLKES